MTLDRIDIALLSELVRNARLSNVELSETVGLSSTAVARRQKSLEEEGVIQGYHALLDLKAFNLTMTIIVRIALDSQTDEALTAFEVGLLKCTSVTRSFLMSGNDDYIAIVIARDIEDFERIHRMELSRLPHVSRIQSSFAMREIVNRAVPRSAFEKVRKLNNRKRS